MEMRSRIGRPPVLTEPQKEEVKRLLGQGWNPNRIYQELKLPKNPVYVYCRELGYAA